MNGWEKLSCDYFVRVVEDELYPYFESLGLSTDRDNRGGVVFRKDSITIRCSYDFDFFPTYLPTIRISKQNRGVPLWFLVGEATDLGRFVVGAFGSEVELRDYFRTLKWQVLDLFCPRIFEEEEFLELAIKQFWALHAETDRSI